MNSEHRAVLEHIRSSSTALAAAVAAVPSGQADRPPRAGEWSARETLIHVRNVVMMVYGLRIRRLLYETDPVFADYDEASARQEDLARLEPLEALMRMITAEHEQIGRLLERLPDDRWTRAGRHPELGPMSIALLASRIGAHAEEHAGQIREIAQAL